VYVFSKLFFLYLYSYFIKDFLRVLSLIYIYLNYVIKAFLFENTYNITIPRLKNNKKFIILECSNSVVRLIALKRFSRVLSKYGLIKVN
jgi:hypothetical protein